LDKLNCIAIDDEPLALEVIKEHAAQLPYVELLAVFTSPLEAMAFLQIEKVDLVFLDIHMPELNGMELPTLVQSTAAFVFVTAYKEYAYDSYALNVADYLLKPVSFDRFVNAVNKVLHRKTNETSMLGEKVASTTKVPYLFVRADKKIVRFATSNIRYIEGMKDYVTIYGTNGKIVARESLKRIADLLAADDFVRIHRSYIVPLHAVKQIEGNRVHLDDKELPIGASYKSELLQRIDAQLIGDRLRN
jgi:DNA-binding LytR/AlgR family response regulator